MPKKVQVKPWDPDDPEQFERFLREQRRLTHALLTELIGRQWQLKEKPELLQLARNYFKRWKENTDDPAQKDRDRVVCSCLLEVSGNAEHISTLGLVTPWWFKRKGETSASESGSSAGVIPQ